MWGVALALLAVVGLLDAAEVLLMGEELSVLGRNLLVVSRDDGALHAWASKNGASSVQFGFAVLAFSFVRLGVAITALRGLSWGLGWSLAMALPLLLVDLACFPFPLNALAGVVGVVALLRIGMSSMRS